MLCASVQSQTIELLTPILYSGGARFSLLFSKTRHIWFQRVWVTYEVKMVFLLQNKLAETVNLAIAHCHTVRTKPVNISQTLTKNTVFPLTDLLNCQVTQLRYMVFGLRVKCFVSNKRSNCNNYTVIKNMIIAIKICW